MKRFTSLTRRVFGYNAGRLIRPRVFLALFAALGVSSTAFAARFASGAVIPSPLRAGETISLRIPSLPAEAEEFELLLSVDDGASYSLRLTPSQKIGDSSFLWTVPALPTDRARLRVRWGDGRREIVTPPSEAFAIRTTPGGRMAPLYQESGEIWIGDSSRALVDQAGLAGDEIRSFTPRDAAALVSSSTTFLKVSERAEFVEDEILAGRRSITGGSDRRPPRTIPLRI